MSQILTKFHSTVSEIYLIKNWYHKTTWQVLMRIAKFIPEKGWLIRLTGSAKFSCSCDDLYFGITFLGHRVELIDTVYAVEFLLL